MDSFSVTTLLTRKDYIKFICGELYKKPQFIIATLFGLFLITIVILNYLRIINYSSEVPYTELFGGLFILIAPCVIALLTARGIYSNASLKHEISYTFLNDGIAVKGLTFESFLKWEHIIKQKQTKRYVLLYHSKRLGNFIDKSKLTPD